MSTARWQNANINGETESRYTAKRKAETKRSFTLSDLPPLQAQHRLACIYATFATTQRPSASLLVSLIRTIGWPFYLSIILKLALLMTYTLDPVVMKSFIGFLEHENDQPVWGLWLAAIIVALFFSKWALTQLSTHLVDLVAKEAESILCASLTEKTLRLSALELERQGQARVLHLFEQQHRISSFFRACHNLWCDPIKILISLTLLTKEVGWMAILALGLGGGSFWVNWNITCCQRLVQERRDNYHKELTKYVNEYIRGIKAIKLNTWEDFATRKAAQKYAELKASETTNRLLTQLNCGQKELFSQAIVVLAVLLMLWQDGQLTSSRIYILTILYSQLRFPLFSFAELYSQLSTILVYLHKLQNYFALPDKTQALAEATIYS